MTSEATVAPSPATPVVMMLLMVGSPTICTESCGFGACRYILMSRVIFTVPLMRPTAS